MHKGMMESKLGSEVEIEKYLHGLKTFTSNVLNPLRPSWSPS